MARCAGTTRDGRQCTAIVKPPNTYCYQHDPARSEERKRNASRAGKSTGGREIRDLKRNISEVVEAATNLPFAPRWVAAIPQKRRYLQMTLAGSPRPYRPERIPERAGAPQPFTEEQTKRYDPDRLKVSLSLFEEKKREALARWGLLKDYDRMKAEPSRTLAKSAPPSTSSLLDLAQTPWKETPWK